MPKSLSKLTAAAKMELTDAALLMRYHTTVYDEIITKYATFPSIAKVLRLNSHQVQHLVN